MKQTVYLSDFRDAFQRMGRGEQFSYEGLEIIYDYLEECDPEMELDVIAICCDFSEGSVKEILDQYDIDLDGVDQDDEDALEEAVLNYLNYETSVLGHSHSGIVFQNF